MPNLPMKNLLGKNQQAKYQLIQGASFGLRAIFLSNNILCAWLGKALLSFYSSFASRCC